MPNHIGDRCGGPSGPPSALQSGLSVGVQPAPEALLQFGGQLRVRFGFGGGVRRPCACAAAHRLVPPHLEMWTNTVSVGGGVSGATGAATAPAIASVALILASRWRHPAGAVAAQPRSSQARSSRRRSCRRRGGSQRCAVVVVAAAAARSAADSNDSDEAPQREGMPSCCGASCSCRRLQIRAANASNRARSHAGEPPRGCLDRRVGKSRSKIRCSSAGERCCDDTILRAGISVCFLKIDSYGASIASILGPSVRHIACHAIYSTTPFSLRWH